MNERARQRLIDRYLARLDRELADVPREARRELVEDVRGHIEEAWAASPGHDQVAIERILERLGTPEVLAREERERLGLGAPPVAQDLGLLDWAAIVLTALLTPVGLILAWLSSHWRVRDKAIATVIALAGPVLVYAVGLLAWTAYVRPAASEVIPVAAIQTTEVVAVQTPVAAEQAPVSMAEIRPSAAPAGAVLALAALWGTPLMAAAYLVLRVRPAARRPLALVPIALAALAFLVLALGALMPLTARSKVTTRQPARIEVRTPQLAP